MPRTLFRRLYTGAASLLLLGSLATITSPSPAIAATPVGMVRTDVSDVEPQDVLTAKNGDITVTSCTGSHSIGSKTVSSKGSVISTTPTIEGPGYNYPSIGLCNYHKAIGLDGSLYGLRAVNEYTDYVVSYTRTGVLKWSKKLVPADCNSTLTPSYISLGNDGNVYVVGSPQYGQCNNTWRLFSFTPNGAIRWEKALGTQGAYYLSTFSANNGGVIVLTFHDIQYFNYLGVKKSTVQLTTPGVYATSSDAQGTIAVIEQGYTREDECKTGSSGDSVTRSIAAYTPLGRTFYYVPKCTYASSASFLSDGRLVFAPGYVGDDARIIALSYDSSAKKTTAKLIAIPLMVDGAREFDPGVAIIPETNGGFLAFRSFTRDRDNGWVKGFQFYLYSPDGNVTAKFNSDEIDPDSSHVAVFSTVALTQGQLSFVAWKCPPTYTSCGAPNILYQIPMAELGMDYPRGTILGVAKQAIDTMAVPGDSFSSGLGSLNDGQAYDDLNCSQSPNAYGRNLDTDPTVKLQMPKAAFLACAGAESQHLLSADYQGQKPQIGRIPVNTKVVLLSIGGNDAKFPRLAALCIFVDCATQAYKTEFAAYIKGLDVKLANVYKAILARAPGAHVYVLGYPYVLPQSDCKDTGESGWWFALNTARNLGKEQYKQSAMKVGLSDAEANTALASQPTISNAEIAWGRLFQGDINLQIAKGVDRANATYAGKVHYVSSTDAGSPALGHELCSAEPHFTGLNLTKAGEALHPNALGQNDLYAEARAALKRYQPQYVLAG